MIEHARIEFEIVCVGGSKHCPQFVASRSYQIFGFMRWALEVLTQGYPILAPVTGMEVRTAQSPASLL